MAKIFIVTDQISDIGELVSGAYAIGGERPAVVSVSEDMTKAAIDAGANVFRIDREGAPFWAYLDTIAALVADHQPAAVFMGLSPNCRLVSGRLAARLGITAFPDAKSIDGTFTTTHLVFGGDAVLTNQSAKAQCIALFGPGQFTPAEHGADGTVTDTPFIAPPWEIKITQTRKKETTAVNLAAAKRIVAVGLGISKEEDLAMARELAELLHAELGCTRPIAEGLGWMPPERYIGISANFVKPDLYVALGISGQVQHTVGITDSKTVVSVNKDPDCAMMKKYADYCLAGDLYQIVPALIQKLKEDA